ncbi:unnamed protein product [Caenorhabditis nigoni]
MRPARVRKQRFDLSQQQTLQSSELDEHDRTAMVNNFPTHYYLGKELEDLEKLENCLRGALVTMNSLMEILDDPAHPVGSSRSLSDEIRADALDCADSGGNGTENMSTSTKSQQIILNCERMLASSCLNLNVWHLSFRINESKREIGVSKCNNQFNIKLGDVPTSTQAASSQNRQPAAFHPPHQQSAFLRNWSTGTRQSETILPSMKNREIRQRRPHPEKNTCQLSQKYWKFAFKLLLRLPKITKSSKSYVFKCFLQLLI